MSNDGDGGHTLQLDQHLRFQHRLLLARRVGIVLLVIGLLAALAGVFGAGGPVSQATAAAGGLEVRFPRFARYQGPVRLEIEAPTPADAADTLSLTIAGDHARHFSIERITPEPERMAATDGGIVFTFAVVPGDRRAITLEGRPEAMGSLSGTVTLDGRAPLPIATFVYP
ncbi:hypothetical protein [Luteimonas suaedae]|uniref:hypothetical protein n=1 Tax=Luteimonas suaedae TaxID=2605430 RepID=UPI0011ECD26B|nr:hypothetical protein [Luteimonas suaedae]